MSVVLAGPWVAKAIESLHEATLVGVVMDAGYTYTDTVDTVSDIVSEEVDGASYDRLTATGTVALVGGAWIVFLPDIDPIDLSDSDPKAGIWWALDAGSDAGRLLIGFDPDTSPNTGSYQPSYVDGLYQLPVDAIDDILAELAAGGGDGVVQTVVAGTNITVDASDPANPVISATGGGGALVATSVFNLLATTATDGTATSFTACVVDPEAEASGVVPAGYRGTMVFDLATFQGLLAAYFPDGANFLILAAGTEQVCLLTADGMTDPFITVPTDVVLAPGGGFAIYDGTTFQWVGAVSFHGIMAGIDSPGEAFGGIEGYLDNERHVRGYFMAPVSSTLFDGPVADGAQPITDDGQQVVKGDLVATLGNVEGDGDPFHWMAVVDLVTGQWGWVPSTGASTPPEAALWGNAITTNVLTGGSKISCRSGAWGVFMGYREALTNIIRGGPSHFVGPESTGVWAINDPTQAGGGAVASVNGQTGVVVLTASDVSAVPVTRSVNGHVLSADVTVTAADVGAPPTTRTITAGTGLTGGGDLSANRTLAPDFGTGAGKVTQGNDSRLSDARTPTAHAASHTSAGSDPLTLAQSQVTGLTAALAALLSATSTRLPARAALAADQSFTSNTTLADLTGVSFAVVAGQTYVIRGRVLATGSAAGDFKVAFTCPAGTLSVSAVSVSNAASSFPTNFVDSGVVFDTSGVAVGNFGTVAASVSTLLLDGYFTCTTSGTVQLQGAQRASDATATTFKAGSHLIWHTV